jgi:hypothetical protein
MFTRSSLHALAISSLVVIEELDPSEVTLEACYNYYYFKWLSYRLMYRGLIGRAGFRHGQHVRSPRAPTRT